MIDSHCHLADPAFAEDLDAVVARARDAGVVHALCVLAAGDPAEAAQAQRLAALWPAVRFAVGVHPHQAQQVAGRPEEAVARVRAALAAQPSARALGEVGLDYHYDFSSPEAQREVFRAQVRLGRQMRLPLVIHSREAEAETLRILREEADLELGGVFHCFTGDAVAARRALDLGFHLSFAGIVTFPRAVALRGAAAIVPADRLLFETDSPYLAPAPHRGRRNEPAWVTEVAAALAAARGSDVEQVARDATIAFETLFRP